MKLLVVGAAGSIGKRRALILEELGHSVTKIDIKSGSYFTRALAREHDAVFVCLPPQQCALIATECAQEHVPFFMEKPAAVTHRDLLPITAVTQKVNIVNMVSCNLRFTAEYRAIQESLPNIGRPLMAYAEFGYYLPWWRDGEYKNYYSCYKVSGGGILLDAIHELDYMFSLFGFPDKSKEKLCVGSSIISGELPDLDVEDTANIHIIYKNWLTLDVHVDYLQKAYKRVFFAIGTKGRIDQTFNVQGSNDMYRREMVHFLQAVKTNTPTIKTVEQHVKLLEFVDRMKGQSDSKPES